jgi:hypothetical protein
MAFILARSEQFVATKKRSEFGGEIHCKKLCKCNVPPPSTTIKGKEKKIKNSEKVSIYEQF